LRHAGLQPTQLKGLGYRPLSGDWTETDDLSVNYLVMAVKP
jgi:2-polyprenyl-3-methyl-5-hydroxy-6-metoxy-1,4-benzoquinol methylase